MWNHLDKIEIFLVYLSKAIFSAQINGSLIEVESGLEFAESYAEYEVSSILNYLALIEQTIQKPSVFINLQN